MKSDQMLKHLLDITVGKCTITQEQVLNEADEDDKEILAGLMILHEDMEYKKEQALIAEKMKTINAMVITYNHEIRNSLSAAKFYTRKISAEELTPKVEGFVKRLDKGLDETISILSKMKEMMGDDNPDISQYSGSSEFFDIHKKK